MIYLYTGNGKGKTTAALGCALRALGHNQTVAVIQFLKGRKDIGEYKIQKKLKNFKVYQFGTKQFIKQPTKHDRQLAQEGLQYIKVLSKHKPNLLILDEICLACKMKLLNINSVIKLLKSYKGNIIITGRYAPKKLKQIADIIVNVKLEKSPKHFPTTKGIEY